MSNELSMQDDAMPPDLEPVHRRLLADSDSWEAEQVPSPDQLAEFLRRTSTQVAFVTSSAKADIAAISDIAAGTAPSTRLARQSRVLSRALPAIAALLLISLGAALFSVMAHTRQQSAVPHYPKSSCAPSQITVHDLQGVRLSGMAMVSPDEGWAWGGNVYGHESGNTFKVTSSGPSLFHYSHCQWLPVQTNPAIIAFNGITMLSAHDGWAWGNSIPRISDSGGTFIILHYNGSQWQRMPLPVPLAVGEDISSLDMLSDQEGWVVVASHSFKVLTLYHGVNGVWKPVSLGSVIPGRVESVAPNEAWIVGSHGEVLLYRDGTIVSFDQLPDDGGASISITMHTPQDGWIFDISAPDGGRGPTLWHFDGTGLSDKSALISNPHLLSAMEVHVLSAQEGWAFLGSPYGTPNPNASSNLTIVTSALWLHNGHWRAVKWPAVNIDYISEPVEVSPVEYWAIGSYLYTSGPTDPEKVQFDALLHFVDGSWWVYS